MDDVEGLIIDGCGEKLQIILLVEETKLSIVSDFLYSVIHTAKDNSQ